MKRRILWLPLAIFALFVIVVAAGLYAPSDRTIRSRLVGQPLPEFALPPALPGRPTVASADFARGEPRLINVFASWCLPCIAEAPHLMTLARRGVPIDAVAVRDRPQDIVAFLSRWGDPYRGIGLDAESRVQLALGSSGVPETFVVDGRGIIRHQHIGAINEADVPEILAAYEAAR
ncbi:MAG: DsbE family thiol:disulfide interchange protein [Pseudomonadota bacterium]|nr:DsbE family thiol:disulfide interchange protein [Pseudomonadota bacterium]